MIQSLIMALVFWVFLGLICWTWAGYPALLWVCVRPRPSMREDEFTSEISDSSEELPSITIIIPVFNGEGVLTSKLQNCLELSYPTDRFDVMVASDGSSDGTAEIARQFAAEYSNIRLVESIGRVGKSVVQNIAASTARGDILMLTDVEAVLGPQALQVVAHCFVPPDVGCVTGHVVWGAIHNLTRARSENLYWRFEHAMWARESTLGILACASGPCMAVRRSLFRDIDPRYGDDVVLPLDVAGQGFRVAYSSSLVALERTSEEPSAALRARARMTLRSLRGTLSRRAIFSPMRKPLMAVGVVSHKLLRWVTPFLFLLVLGSAVPLALQDRLVPRVVLALQLGGLATAFAGNLAYRLNVRIPVMAAANDLALDNLGMLIGVTRAILGHCEVVYRSESR